MQPILSVQDLSKTYDNGFKALKRVSLDVRKGEILALLGPNGAGKTTLISIVCGIVNASAGSVEVAGHDIVRDYRAARAMIGLVPQELTTDAFETVWATVSFSRGLFNKPKNPGFVEQVMTTDPTLFDFRYPGDKRQLIRGWILEVEAQRLRDHQSQIQSAPML